jgi:hypothetical protein
MRSRSTFPVSLLFHLHLLMFHRTKFPLSFIAHASGCHSPLNRPGTGNCFATLALKKFMNEIPIPMIFNTFSLSIYYLTLHYVRSKYVILAEKNETASSNASSSEITAEFSLGTCRRRRKHSCRLWILIPQADGDRIGRTRLAGMLTMPMSEARAVGLMI